MGGGQASLHTLEFFQVASYKISHFEGRPQGPLFSSGPVAVADVVPVGPLDFASFVPLNDGCSAFSPEAAGSASQAKLTLETA